MKKLLLFFIFTSIGTWLAAQSVVVRGNVTDGNEPLVGVSIVVKGTSNGTITDLDGNYELQAEANGTLMFSYIGYVSQEIPISARRVVTFHASHKLKDQIQGDSE